MLNAFQRLGDRIVGRLVPEVTAEAGVQEHTVSCGCRWDSPGYIKWQMNCAGAACSPCYAAGPC